MSPVYIVWLYNDDHRCVWHLIENKLFACALAPNPIKGDGGGDGDDGSSTQSATPLLPNDVVFEIYANADMKASENTEGRRRAATTRSKKEKQYINKCVTAVILQRLKYFLLYIIHRHKKRE